MSKDTGAGVKLIQSAAAGAKPENTGPVFIYVKDVIVI
jgi:hypothetical protein